MRISLAIDIPFQVGDLVWVNRPYSDQDPYYQAVIIQIILDGREATNLVIRERAAEYALVIRSGVYDLKPTGNWRGLARATVSVEFADGQTVLFAAEDELLHYRLRTRIVG